MFLGWKKVFFNNRSFTLLIAKIGYLYIKCPQIDLMSFTNTVFQQLLSNVTFLSIDIDAVVFFNMHNRWNPSLYLSELKMNLCYFCFLFVTEDCSTVRPSPRFSTTDNVNKLLQKICERKSLKCFLRCFNWLKLVINHMKCSNIAGWHEIAIHIYGNVQLEHSCQAVWDELYSILSISILKAGESVNKVTDIFILFYLFFFFLNFHKMVPVFLYLCSSSGFA